MSSKKTPSFFSYLQSDNSFWYWTTLVLAIISGLTVFLVPEDNYFISIRHLLGLVMILWLPGYSLTHSLFPSYTLSSKTSIDDIERFALSVGTCLALVSIIGLILNYTPWGINLTSIVFCLFLTTTLFATTGIWRQYVSAKSYSQNS